MRNTFIPSSSEESTVIDISTLTSGVQSTGTLVEVEDNGDGGGGLGYGDCGGG